MQPLPVFFTQQVGWWAGGLGSWGGFQGGVWQRRTPQTLSSLLADGTLDLELRALGSVYDDVKLILHHAVFPLCPGVCQGRFGGCVCLNVNTNEKHIVRGHFYEKHRKQP